MAPGSAKETGDGGKKVNISRKQYISHQEMPDSLAVPNTEDDHDISADTKDAPPGPGPHIASSSPQTNNPLASSPPQVDHAALADSFRTPLFLRPRSSSLPDSSATQISASLLNFSPYGQAHRSTTRGQMSSSEERSSSSFPNLASPCLRLSGELLNHLAQSYGSAVDSSEMISSRLGASQGPASGAQATSSQATDGGIDLSTLTLGAKAANIVAALDGKVLKDVPTHLRPTSLELEAYGSFCLTPLDSEYAQLRTLFDRNPLADKCQILEFLRAAVEHFRNEFSGKEPEVDGTTRDTFTVVPFTPFHTTFGESEVATINKVLAMTQEDLKNLTPAQRNVAVSIKLITGPAVREFTRLERTSCQRTPRTKEEIEFLAFKLGHHAEEVLKMAKMQLLDLDRHHSLQEDTHEKCLSAKQSINLIRMRGTATPQTASRIAKPLVRSSFTMPSEEQMNAIVPQEGITLGDAREKLEVPPEHGMAFYNAFTKIPLRFDPRSGKLFRKTKSVDRDTGVLLSVEEVRAHLVPEGITFIKLCDLFGLSRVTGVLKLSPILQKIARYDSATSTYFPLDEPLEESADDGGRLLVKHEEMLKRAYQMTLEEKEALLQMSEAELVTLSTSQWAESMMLRGILTDVAKQPLAAPPASKDYRLNSLTDLVQIGAGLPQATRRLNGRLQLFYTTQKPSDEGRGFGWAGFKANQASAQASESPSTAPQKDAAGLQPPSTAHLAPSKAANPLPGPPIQFDHDSKPRPASTTPSPSTARLSAQTIFNEVSSHFKCHWVGSSIVINRKTYGETVVVYPPYTALECFSFNPCALDSVRSTLNTIHKSFEKHSERWVDRDRDEGQGRVSNLSSAAEIRAMKDSETANVARAAEAARKSVGI